ncbi:MAG: hypothetical protein ABSH41_06990 [Syntrophobacteraceae bacterium]
MAYTFGNTHHKIKSDIYDFTHLIRFAKLYGWNPRHDLGYICLALKDGTEDIKTGKRDKELFECLYPTTTFRITPVSSMIRKQIIKLSKEFIKLYQDGYIADGFSLDLYSDNMIDRVDRIGFSIWKKGSPHQGFLKIESYGWPIIRSLARAYGWFDNDIFGESESYHDNCELSYSQYQSEVSAENVRDLVQALREAIEDIMTGQRNHDIIESHECDQYLLELIWSDRLRNGKSVPEAAEFRKTTIALLQRFVKLCEAPPLWIVFS